MPFICLFIISFLSVGAYSFYPNNFDESRSEFEKVSKLAQEKFSNAEFKRFSIPTQTNKDLSIDFLYIPQQSEETERLLIITSGVHGVEAYTGSAIEIDLIKQILRNDLPKTMGVLIIQNINPYGFFFNRRVTENNVDLNRNFSLDGEIETIKNDAYEKFDSFLNPQTKLKTNFINDSLLFIKSITKLMLLGKKQMTQAIVGGQYQNPKGIYFGGKSVEPNVSFVEMLFKEKGLDYPKILHIDLHTGYGEKGRLHFFSTQSATQIKGFNEIFSGFSIDKGSDEGFYHTSGSFDQFTFDLFKDKIAIPMTFEFGTMDSQTILGGFYSLKNMIYENQGFQFGYIDEKSKLKSSNDFIDMFNPPEKKWRDNILKTSNDTFEIILERYSKF